MRTKAGGVLCETLAVAAAGLMCALAANSLSPRGLSLTRDYFPKSAGVQSAPTTPTSRSSPVPSATAPLSNPPAGGPVQGEDVWARLQQKGLQPIRGQDALALFQDPSRAQDLIVFVDARDDTHYQAGHIPGAYQFDRYYPDKYLPGVLPVCANALKIVVYCTGGACEDSEFAALTLKDAGMPAEKIFVFAGGITEWTGHGWPVESGARNSGLIKANTP